MDKVVDLDAVGFELDGAWVETVPRPGERLSGALRERLGSRDVKIGCDAGDCGACTVLVDGAAICACLMPVQQARGRRVETQAGLVRHDALAQRLADSFEAHGAAQCGICTPGMMVAAIALLRDVARPDAGQVMDALGGVLCRCTGYRKIVAAVVAVGADTVPAPITDGSTGTSIRRLDGRRKVAGTEAFGDDVAPPDTLVVRVIRSPHHRAGVSLGDLDGWAAARPGIAAVLTAADIPGTNHFGVIPGFVDQPVFAEAEALFRGEAVAAVIGTPDAIAALDEGSLPIAWEERAPLLTPPEAMAEGAPLLHPDRDGNVMCGGLVDRGDADAALARADVVVEGHYGTAFVEHAYIEPEAGFATYADGRVTIHACTQAPVMDQEGLAGILGLTLDRVRIVPTGVGGGFGSKLDLSVQPFLALAAMKTGRPVRLAYSRTESMQSTTKRHPADIRLRIGATAAGDLCGMTFDGTFNTGAYSSWGPTVASRVPIHASGPYRIADYRAEARGVHTHCAPAGAFRGFGVPQSAIAQEGLFDALVDKLGLDRLEFRLRNALVDGAPTVCGQVFEGGVGIGACLEALRPVWRDALADAETFNAGGGPIRRGVGIASGWYGCGNTSLPNPSTIKSGLHADGRVVLHQGATDIGQGSNTAIAQIFARALGASVHDLTLVGPDTDVTPDAGKTSASRQTFVSGNAARLSGEALRARILALVNAAKSARLAFVPGAVIVTDGDRTHRVDLNTLDADAEGYVVTASETYDPPTRALDARGQGTPYAQFGYAAHLAVVDVDTEMGTVRAVRVVAAHDVGHAINPMLVEGQVEGGVAQGLGMALMEEFIPGQTENLHDYLIPTIGDVPPIETLIVEVPDPHGPYGAKGLGEHALIPTAPALLGAIHHATGVRMTRVPVTPARLRVALRERDHA